MLFFRIWNLLQHFFCERQQSAQPEQQQRSSGGARGAGAGPGGAVQGLALRASPPAGHARHRQQAPQLVRRHLALWQHQEVRRGWTGQQA